MNIRQAIASLDVAAVSQLLFKADLTQVDAAGRTLLHEACDAAHRDPHRAAVIVRMLVHRGASAQARDDFGRTPLDIAHERGVGDVLGRAMAAGMGAHLAEHLPRMRIRSAALTT